MATHRPDDDALESDDAPTADELEASALDVDDLVDDAEDGEESDEGDEEESEDESADKPRKGKKKDDDPDAELEFANLPVPGEKRLREAMAWAFEGEDDVTEDLLDRFTRHALMVLEGNKRMNLTAITDPKEVAAKHYLDSWRITRFLPLLGRRILDVGSGAGFPGIPLALAEPNTNVTLIDSTKKRVDFMQESIDALEIKNCSAVWERAEEHLARNKYDIVTMRALSSVRENVRLLRKVRHSHKDLVMLKGPSWSREVRAGEREAERLGFHLATVFEHELPDGMGGRGILVYRAPGGHGE